MHMLTLNGGHLAVALSRVGKIVDKPSEGSVHQCVYCVPGGGALYLHTTNGTLWCSVSIDAQGSMEPFLVHWETFRRFAAANKIKELTLTPKTGGIQIRGEGSRCVLAAPDPKNFPSWPESRPETWVVLPGETLVAMIDRVIKHNGKLVTFPAMTGFSLELQDGGIGLTATDGKRLAHVETKVEEAFGSGAVVVPQATLDLLTAAQGPITLAVNRFRLTASWERTTLISKLIDGRYPDWRAISSVPLPREARIAKKDLVDAMKQLLDIDTYCGVKIDIESAFLWSIGKQGQASIRVPCKAEHTETLYLVPDQICDFLGRMEGDDVLIRWGLPQGPIRLVDPSHEGDICIAMGCRPIPAPTEGIEDA
jgi:DNA polymerase III sliding clamp (beta) subunit (PCNA family)